MVICKHCNDTHTVSYINTTGGGTRMCNYCPSPCRLCRAGDYCATTPCPCTCHQQYRLPGERQGWTLEEGLSFCRRLQADLAELNVWVALSGGVLIQGSSRKDLDVQIVPHIGDHGTMDEVRECLASLGFKRLTTEHRRANDRVTVIRIVDTYVGREDPWLDKVVDACFLGWPSHILRGYLPPNP